MCYMLYPHKDTIFITFAYNVSINFMKYTNHYPVNHLSLIINHLTLSSQNATDAAAATLSEST